MAERDIVKLDEFPSNSFSSKEKDMEKKEKKVERIVKTKVVKRKKSLGERFAEVFLGDSSANVGSYIIYDVLIPAAKDTLSDIVTGGIEMLLYGDRGGSSTHRRVRDRGRSYVSYRSYYDEKDSRRDSMSERSSRRKQNLDDILLESRSEAEAVLENMIDIVREFDAVTVADLYQMVGIHTDYTDNKWGWDNLSASYVERTRGGYRLHLPKPILLD